MRNSVLQRKMARIVMLLAESANIEPEQALGIFYNTETYKLISNPETGLHLMSDGYILENLMQEIRK